MAKEPDKADNSSAEASKSGAQAAASSESIRLYTDPYLDRIPPEVHADPVSAGPIVLEAEPQEEVSEPIPEPETVEAKPVEPEPVAAATPPQAPAPAPTVVEKRGGFFPLLLGGLIAGLLGFGAAYYLQSTQADDVADQLAEQSATINTLRQEFEALPTIDLSGIEATQAQIASNIADIQNRIDDEVAAINQRFDELGNQPVGADGVAAGPAIAAYEAELNNLRAQVEELTGTARAQLDEARAEANAIEENAAAAARAAAGRAAIARVQTAMESGAAMGPALEDLGAVLDQPIPDALLAVQDGVPTLASLQDDFPDLARAALATARAEGEAGEETSGLGAFLRNQLDVRSVSPQEGNTVDAILSRAEDALQRGQLSQSLAELDALPDIAKAGMSDWLARAQARDDAVTAANDLLNSLNDS